MRYLLWLVSLLPVTLLSQHTMHDATVTDTDGTLHRLYADYLDNNKVVVLKFFFTSCPPCIANAPQWQQKYVQYGSGTQGVRFFNVTTISGDTDTKVASFESTYSQTMPGISHTGGAPAITDPFKNGQFGSWYGTPSFAVIAPNRTLHYPVFFNQIDQVIALASTQTVVIPSTYTLSVASTVTIPDGDVQWFLRDAADPAKKTKIEKNTAGMLQFIYPSASFPALTTPEVIMETSAAVSGADVKASDLLVLSKHILGIAPLTDPRKIVAADVNGSGQITASDMLVLRKGILGLITRYPNNVPTYRQYPGPATLPAITGGPVPVPVEVIRMGKIK